MNSFNLLNNPPRIPAESVCQRDKNSLLIRSRLSPVARATLNGLVFDQLGAVSESFNI
jgi:hypothetical protein